MTGASTSNMGVAGGQEVSSKRSGSRSRSRIPVQQVVCGPVFHPRCGQLVSLTQGNRTASRSHATQVLTILHMITAPDGTCCYSSILPPKYCHTRLS